MFERYTERARRVLFFSRYEASQRASQVIEPVDLLLGLIRDGKGLTERILGTHAEALRAECLNQLGTPPEPGTSPEIPFSPQAKRILVGAAEAADKHQNPHIGTEHLLLSLTTVESPVVALLASFGITYATAIKRLFDAASLIASAVANRQPTLDLSGLNLTSLPQSLASAQSLVRVDLSDNWLTEVPPALRHLTHLQTLDLTRNRLADLPDWLVTMPSLRQLFLHGNDGLRIPREVLGSDRDEVLQGHDAVAAADILRYYGKLVSSLPLNEAKLILLGRGGVGKTSLVNRLLSGTFDPQQTKTDGIQIVEWSMALKEGDRVHLRVWDFGGQEILHATHQFFLTQRSLYLIVISGREGAEDADAEYWLRFVQAFGGGSAAILVLNKINAHFFDLNRRALLAKYPFVIETVMTDCEDGTGITELVCAIERAADRLEDLRVRIPTSWWRVKKALSALKVDFVSFHDYRELCRECGESDGNAQEELASRLHDLGVAINFRTDPRLTETHVLNPHWVTGGIYAILSSPHLSQQKGELRLQELSNILDTRVYPVRMHMFLMDLMKKFELCFSFPDDEWRYLVPELLDKQEPEEVSEFDVDDCLNFEFHYSIIPEGLLPRFIVRSCVLSSGQQRWRTGAILRFEGNQALVRADIEQKIVSVSVGGPVKGRTRLLAVIRSDFDRIHQGISGLNPRQIVPVPGYPAAVAPYDDLRVWEAEGRSTYAVRIGDRVIDLSVKELLEGVELTPRQENAETTKRHPLRLFCSYSHKDETLRAELDTHLKLLQRLGVLKVWHDRRIDPGRDWSAAIDRHAEEADVVLLLVSADFLASDYCYEVEMKQALARHNRGELKVVPVIVRDVNWASAPFAKLQVLPRNGVPVASFPDRDAAWREVSDAVERMAL